MLKEYLILFKLYASDHLPFYSVIHTKKDHVSRSGQTHEHINYKHSTDTVIVSCPSIPLRHLIVLHILTSISTSAESWRHMTRVPTRAMLFTQENMMREIVATWCRNIIRKSWGDNCRENITQLKKKSFLKHHCTCHLSQTYANKNSLHENVELWCC